MNIFHAIIYIPEIFFISEIYDFKLCLIGLKSALRYSWLTMYSLVKIVSLNVIRLVDFSLVFFRRFNTIQKIF